MIPFEFSVGTAPRDTRVVVAMSGGVDSSVVAALLHEAGYQVIGLTMQLYNSPDIAAKKGTCCAGQDIYDAKQVADRFGFPHYVLDYESQFKSAVIDDFVNEYTAGYTPIPCVKCNQSVKFQDLLKTAQQLGAQALVTGHYARRLQGPSKAELHRAIEHKKDQSFFLFATTQEQLEYVYFPLGNISKEETRRQAERLGLGVAQKPDSQGICFVPDGDYAGLINRLKPGSSEPGEVRHIDDRLMGYHEGTIHYTVGQRRKLNTPSLIPLYVVKVDTEKKQVIVGPKEALARSDFNIQGINWIGEEKKTRDCTVKIRSLHIPLPATLSWDTDDSAHIHLHAPEYGIAPGQACVIYEDSRVLGGGWIQKGD